MINFSFFSFLRRLPPPSKRCVHSKYANLTSCRAGGSGTAYPVSSVLAMSPRGDGDLPEGVTSPPAHGAPSARRDPGNYKTSGRTSLRRSSTRNPCEGKGRGLRKCPRAFAPPSRAIHPGPALPALPLPQQPGPQAARLSQEPTGGAELTGSRGREWERGGSRAEPPWPAQVPVLGLKSLRA